MKKKIIIILVLIFIITIAVIGFIFVKNNNNKKIPNNEIKSNEVINNDKNSITENNEVVTQENKLDIKLWTLASKGQIVPDRSLLKTPEQIEMIKKSAELNTAVLDHVAAHIHAGMSTAEIDKLVYNFTTEHGGIPAPLNYEGFPKSVCTSINNVICHGIPSENEILIDGDM